MSTAATEDPFNLVRFLDAQAGDYAGALAELRAGRKRTHWIWYVLPQLRGLGMSQFSHHYGIASLAEARAYAAHPVLGARLVECVEAIGRHKHGGNGTRGDMGAEDILGPVDATKYRSCLTLFKQATGPDTVFAKALADYFDGHEDQRTLALLATESPANLKR
jgi:uncharacterized protein (DUF1810 family)